MDCAFKAISDLDKELKFKDTEVCLTNDDKIVIKYDGREDRFDLSELKGAYVEDGVGIGKLILVKKVVRRLRRFTSPRGLLMTLGNWPF